MPFYLQRQITHKNNIKKSILQTYLTQKHHISKSMKYNKEGKRVSLFASQRKGSITVEAAIVVPLFLFAVMNLLYSMDIIRLYSNMEIAMHQTGKQMAVQAYAYDKIKGEDPNIFSVAGGAVVQQLYIKESILNVADKEYLEHSPIVNGKEGISFLKSSIMEEDMIDLVAEYKVKPLISIMGFGKIPFLNRCRMRAWTGYDNTKAQEASLEGEQYVYITDTGVVYHTNRNCTHLELSILSSTMEELPNLRNDSGGKYKPCELCGKINEDNQIIIAKQGDRYHKSATCSGLKRTVFTILISEVGNRTLCQRCSGKE